MVTEVLDLIKQLYAKGNPEVKEIILQHFIKEEVEKPSYKDIKTVKDVYDYIFKNTSNTFNLKDDYIGVAKFIEISAINAVLNELSPTSDNNEDYYTAYEIQFYGTGYDPDPKEIDAICHEGWQYVHDDIFAKIIENNNPQFRTTNGLIFYNKDVAQHFLTHFKSSICKWL